MLGPKLIRKYIPPNIIDFKAIKSIYRYKSKLNSLQTNYKKLSYEEYVDEKNLYKILLKSDAFAV